MNRTSAENEKENEVAVRQARFPYLAFYPEKQGFRREMVANVTSQTLLSLTVKKVRRGSIVYTDKFRGYDALMYCGYKYLSVDHSSRFCQGKVYINGLEGFWSWAKERLLKPMVPPKQIRIMPCCKDNSGYRRVA